MTDANGSADAGNPDGNASGNWTEGFSEEARAVVESKGWDGPGAVVESFTNLEKLFGADRAGNTVALPKNGEDVDALNNIYTRLGRPEAPEGYKIPDPPQGVPQNGAFVDAMIPVCHDAGLTQSQLEKVVNGYNGFAAKYLENDAKQIKEKAAKEDEALNLQWGDQTDAKMAAAKKAAQAVPTDVADVGKLLDTMEGDNVVGRADIFRLFNWLGEKYFTEDGLDGEGGGNFGMTPEQAKQQIDSLTLDPEFNKSLFDANNPGHKAAKEKWDRLHEIAASKSAA